MISEDSRKIHTDTERKVKRRKEYFAEVYDGNFGERSPEREETIEKDDKGFGRN